MSDLLPFRILLLRSGRIFTDKINQLLQTSELNYSLWQALFVIAQSDQTTLIEISNELSISQPAVSKRIYDLERKRLIECVPSINRREKIVQLTPTGLSLYEKCKMQIETLEQKQLENIPLEDRLRVREILTQFMNNLRSEDFSHE